MGQEIVYCFKCSSRIVGPDSAKGALTIGGRVACAACAPALLQALPPREREELLARAAHEPRGNPRPASKRTPSRGTEIVPPGPAPNRAPMVLAIAGALIVLALLLAFLSGGSPTRPPEAPPLPPPERGAGKPTPPPADLPRPKASYDVELARIDESIAGVIRQEGFKEALDYLASARKRHDAPEWTLAIDRRLGKTNDEVRNLYASLENKALDARRRGSEPEVKELCDRVGRWNLPDRAAELKKTLEGAVLAAFRQGADGIVCVEAEHFSSRTDAAGHSWTPVQQPAGFEGGGAMAGLPNDGSQFMTDYAAKSPRLDYRIEFVKPGPHYLWVRASAEADTDNSVHAGLDGEPLRSLGQIGFSPAKKWVWTNKQMDGKSATFTIAAPGIHTIQLWMREDGAAIDRFVLTSDPKWGPKGNGPAESPR